MRPRLYLSHRADVSVLTALEFGIVDDGQPDDRWEIVGADEDFAFLRVHPHCPIVGFKVIDLQAFDAEHPAHAQVWDEPLFDVPLLALREAPAGAILSAARTHFGPDASTNRTYFDAAVNKRGKEALRLWWACLESGDAMAHFAIGYTLYDLGRFEEAYRHLRYYAEIAPAHPWNWCWFGKAAEAVGSPGEARQAYERAIELEQTGGNATDAPELLEALGPAGH